MILHVTKMENKGDFKVYVEFNDGFRGIIDFKKAFENDYRKYSRTLLDPEMFNTVHLALHTLCWDNGMDFAPESLYSQVKIQANVA
jgi:hypothetical protein